MYFHQTDQSACFDPNIMPEDNDQQNNNAFSHELNPAIDDLDLQTQNPHLAEPSNWMPTNANSEMSFDENHHHTSSNNSITDLLTTLQLPKSSFDSSNSFSFVSFGKSSPSSSSMGFLGLGDQLNNSNYDPLFHLNLPNQANPSLRDLLLQQLPEGYSNGMIQQDHDDQNNRFGNMSSLFGICGLENNNMNNGTNYGVSGIYQGVDDHHDHHSHNHNGIFEFNSGNPCLGEAKEGKCPKNFVTERQRRQNFTDKYQHLKSLVPNPTKGDRASIVQDAIDYIMELKRTVAELKLLVEKKRITKERHKRMKNNTDDKSSINPGDHEDHDQVHVKGTDGPVLVKPDPDMDFDGFGSTQLRSSWLQRKCKDTEVDVRIVDDEVTIKLVQRKKINCLLSVSRTLDELQLDLRHVAGGHVGDYYSYLFNSKICEGSSVYASAIANKLIEVVERQYASASASASAFQPTTSF